MSKRNDLLELLETNEGIFKIMGFITEQSTESLNELPTIKYLKQYRDNEIDLKELNDLSIQRFNELATYVSLPDRPSEDVFIELDIVKDVRDILLGYN